MKYTVGEMYVDSPTPTSLAGELEDAGYEVEHGPGYDFVGLAPATPEEAAQILQTIQDVLPRGERIAEVIVSYRVKVKHAKIAKKKKRRTKRRL